MLSALDVVDLGKDVEANLFDADDGAEINALESVVKVCYGHMRLSLHSHTHSVFYLSPLLLKLLSVLYLLLSHNLQKLVHKIVLNQFHFGVEAHFLLNCFLVRVDEETLQHFDLQSRNIGQSSCDQVSSEVVRVLYKDMVQFNNCLDVCLGIIGIAGKEVETNLEVKSYGVSTHSQKESLHH